MTNANYSRLAILISGMSVGGAERSIVTILPEFLEKAKVDLIVFQKLQVETDIFQHRNLNIYYLNARNLFDFKQFNNLRKKIVSYDIIFSHLIWAQIWSGFIAFLNTNLRDRLIWVEHNMYEDRRKFVWYLLAKLGKFTKTIVAVSEEVSNYYSKKTNLKSIVIPNPVLGLPLNNFKRDLVDRKLRIVCLGRLVYQKRVDLALKLFKDFQTKNSIKINSELIIIGGGPLEKNLKLQAEVISNISFTGYLNHYESLNLLKGCHIYLNTSDYEGFCISRIEALSMGLCVLSRKNAGYTQLKAILGSTEKMEQIGIFFIDDDPIFFEQALIELSSAKYWTEEKINKRIEVSKVFLPKNISSQYLRLTNL